MYFRAPGANRSGRTVVRINGNAEAWELQAPGLSALYTAAGVNFLVVNFRGVGRSRFPRALGSERLGVAAAVLGSRRALSAAVLDTWSVVQFVLRALGVPEPRVAVVGHSIGGALAAALLAQRPLRVALCSSRSFARLLPVAAHLAPVLLEVPPHGLRGRALTRLTQALLWLGGWVVCAPPPPPSLPY